jgi:pyruvate dehydrogenase E2 component (dihydrolipoamide acetyltransferase)
VALDRHRDLNVQFDGNAVKPVSGSHVALAVAREDGAVAAPVLSQVSSLTDEALADSITPLVERARAGRLTATDVQPAAIAVSNLGMFGVDDFTAMVTPPQVMVLSVGRVHTVPVWHEASASFVPEQRVTVVLGSDHRVVNGAQAAQFLASVAEFIEGK